MLTSHAPAMLLGTHVRKVTSSVVGQAYEISVWLPPEYANAPDKRYPVLYILDADLGFGLAAHMLWLLIYGQELSPMIIIGIGWHVTDLEDWFFHRQRDFCPAAIEGVAGSKDGGAADFLAFIETELMPFINSNYRTDSSNQNIWGASVGGLFVLYALLQKPGLFRGVVAGCPALWAWASGMIELEKQFAESGKALPVKLYIAAGELEWAEGIKVVEQFYRTLESRNYEGLTLKYEILDGETHFSAVARLFITGVREIFKT